LFPKNNQTLFIISIKRPPIIGSKSHSGGKELQEVFSPSPCPKQGHLWDQTKAAQGFLQAGLETLQRWSLPNLTGSAA